MVRAEAHEHIYTPVSRELEQVFEAIVGVAEEEAEHPAELEDRLAHVLAAPGKRIRPAITLLTARLWGRTPDERTIKMATAVELLHIATLIHDDTVDSADTRRGHATASNLWGGNVAVLLGDYVFATSAKFVCDTHSIRLIRRFAETIAELSRGELHEVLRAWQSGTTREQYFTRIYDKTASLFATSAESGAVLGEADEESIDRLRDYGYNLGMAYQVFDDLLDYESTTEELGKPACHDLAEGVMTLPSIIAYENGGARDEIEALFETPEGERAEPLQRAVEAISRSGALDQARAVADDFARRSYDALAGMPPSQSLDSLVELARYASNRRR